MTEIGQRKLQWRDIHRDLQMRRPAGRLTAGLAQHPFAEGDDNPAFLGNRNEDIRRHHAPCRVLPAHQRLVADDLAAFD